MSFRSLLVHAQPGEASKLRTTMMEFAGACTVRLALAPASSRRFRITGGLPV